MWMGRVVARLEALNAHLREQPSHALLGTASLHASTITGGREWSSYPERCLLQIERRTLPGEPAQVGYLEVGAVLDDLRAEDAEFAATARHVFGRPGYEIAASHSLPVMLTRAAEGAGCHPRRVGMSFWTDAAVLDAAGIPTVLFGPGGAGLHGPDEYVRAQDVCTCRDVLVSLARQFTS
jgi:acetylornithine deacetylase